MQIVLATSPHVRHAAVLQNEFRPDPSVMYTFAPVGLLSLSAVLRREMLIDPVLFDTNLQILTGSIPLDLEFYRSAASRICEHEPDVLGFMTECDSYHHVLQIMAAVNARRPQCRCVLGGPHATAVARVTMERHDFVEAIVLGEGENTLPELVRAFSAGTDDPVPGALRRAATRRIVDGGPRPLAQTLDDLPIPAYDKYRAGPGEEIFVEAGRGCPFQCTFCSTAPFWQRRHRVKSPMRILAEVGVIRELYGTERVHFTHDLLTTDRRWVSELCHTLIGARVPVKWTCSARTDTVDRELLDLMAAAGCYAIYFGLESGSQRLLKEIKKNVPVPFSLDVLRQCRDAGIRPNAGFIAGLPTEDRTSLGDTFAAFQEALELGTRPTHVFGFCPFAASTMYGALDTLECDGHFLDIPIQPELDARNRQLIASDAALFGGYFRPRLELSPSRISGVDEFSNLVEPIAAPTLSLARALGGMLEVFDRWTDWIERHNDKTGVPAHRRYYGSPVSFARFVTGELEALRSADDPMLQLAKVLRMSLEVAVSWTSVPPTTMATHRSVEMPMVKTGVSLENALCRTAVLATMQVDYDVVPFLDASPHDLPSPVRKPTYLMWDLTEDRRIRLSQVDPFLYESLAQLEQGPQPVAALVLHWAERGEPLDYARMMHVLSEARAMRLVETV